MDSSVANLLQKLGARDDLFSSNNLGLLFWGGLGVLTIALLILMRTRWGQAKPLSKCVVLSVFAHVLLIGYAYGTKLIFDYPDPVEPKSIQLAIVGSDETSDQEAPVDARQPWDQFAFEPASSPDIELPSRQDFHVDVPTSVVQVAAPSFQTGPVLQAVPIAEPMRPVPVLTQPEVRVASDPAPSEVPVEEIATPTPDSFEPLVPDETELPRQLISDVAETNVAPPEPDVPKPLIEDDGQLQRLTDVTLDAASGDAILDDNDSLPATKNQDDSATPDQTAGNALRYPDEPDGNPLRDGDAARAVVRRLGDGKPVPPLYSLRQAGDRLRVAERFGGNARTEAAVDSSLIWLSTSQREDGRWDASRHGAGLEQQILGHDRNGAGADADTGITGLALLAYLGAGHTHFEGEHRKNVQYGLEFLLRSQKSDGNLAGDARLHAKMYCHGIALLALSEAYVMTGDYRLEPFIKRAVKYTVDAQHPTVGGWRYLPGDRGDTSQFGWQVMALVSAESSGIQIPGETRAGMLRFLRNVASGTHGGLAAYRPGDRPSRTMTAEALACRYFLKAQHRVASKQEAVAFVMQELPDASRPNLYYWYYATLALFQVQGDDWRGWNVAMQQQLLDRQRHDGDLAGSWDPDTVWGGYGGRVYTTAMAALCLEVYYRYLPVYDRLAEPRSAVLPRVITR